MQTIVSKFSSNYLVLKDVLKHEISQHPRLFGASAILCSLYSINKIYQKWKYNQKQFNPETTDLSTIGILITGCDTGIGNALAHKLSKLGYCTIATCYTTESTNTFNNDINFTKNGSFALQMDVTKMDSINTCKSSIKQWLAADNNRIFWGIVNNAGFGSPGSFEIIPYSWMMYEYKVLFFGVINVTRLLFPLLYGRRMVDGINIEKNAKQRSIMNTNSVANGGRVVNVSSLARMMNTPGMTRYGVSKSAVSYFSHVLRLEMCGIFGIWSCACEPGAFKTNFLNVGINNLNKLKEYYDENINDKLTDEEKNIGNIYSIIENVDNQINGVEKLDNSGMFDEDLSECVDAIIHGLTAKYPQRLYQPGFNFIFGIITSLPNFIFDKIANDLAVVKQNETK